MKLPNSLTDDELLQYANTHLQYEFDMLTVTTGIMTSLVAQKKDGLLFWAINNSLLNSYALHARNIINFLFSHSLKKDHASDIIIEDYLDKGAVVSTYITIPPLLNEALTKTSKQVAHLTMERIQYEQGVKGWWFIEIDKQIKGALALLIPHVPDTRMSKSLRQKLGKPGFQSPIVVTENLGGVNSDGISFSLKLNGSNEIKK